MHRAQDPLAVRVAERHLVSQSDAQVGGVAFAPRDPSADAAPLLIVRAGQRRAEANRGQHDHDGTEALEEIAQRGHELVHRIRNEPSFALARVVAGIARMVDVAKEALERVERGLVDR